MLQAPAPGGGGGRTLRGPDAEPRGGVAGLDPPHLGRLICWPPPHDCYGHVGSPAQGCIRREEASNAAPQAVRQAFGGGCKSGWGRLLSVTNAIEAGTCRQGEAGPSLGAMEGGGGCLPLFQCIAGPAQHAMGGGPHSFTMGYTTN